MAQRSLALSTFPEREAGNAITRLFRAVIAEAVRCDDALDWIATADAALVCALADVEREAVERAILRGDVPRRRVRGGIIGSHDAPPLTQKHGARLGKVKERQRVDSGKRNRFAGF